MSYQKIADGWRREFNELVNMTAEELKDWLGSEESAGSEDIEHMRRVVAYNKRFVKSNVNEVRKPDIVPRRHLAQEGKAKQDTNSKSYKSLKN